jgi:restriction system protein
MGGLIIVQAKRYSGSSASTTSENWPACWRKEGRLGHPHHNFLVRIRLPPEAREYGRMELIDGEKPTYLIKEYLGQEVLIGTPSRPHTKNSNGG